VQATGDALTALSQLSQRHQADDARDAVGSAVHAVDAMIEQDPGSKITKALAAVDSALQAARSAVRKELPEEHRNDPFFSVVMIASQDVFKVTRADCALIAVGKNL
jgi:hypothetical protein